MQRIVIEFFLKVDGKENGIKYYLFRSGYKKPFMCHYQQGIKRLCALQHKFEERH